MIRETSFQNLYTSPQGNDSLINTKEMSKATKKLEKIGKLLEKQFEHQIKSQFGQHIPKVFVKAMVYNKLESFLELMADGELGKTIEHDHALIQKLQTSLPTQAPIYDEVYEIEGYEISIKKGSKVGWEVKIVELDGHRRIKKIRTTLPGQIGWNSIKNKILVKLVQERLEHRHVHKAKEMSKNIVDSYSNSITPVIIDGIVRSMENFSHSYKMAGHEKLGYVGGYFAGAAMINGAFEIHEGVEKGKESLHLKKESAKLKTAFQGIQNPEMQAKIQELDKISKKLRHQAIGRLMIGGTTVIEGSSTLAYTTAVKTAAIVASTTVTAAALGTTAGSMIIVAGLTSGVIHAHGLHKINKRLKAVKQLDIPTHKELVQDFKNMQKRMLNNAKLNKCLNITGDTVAVAGGAVLIAAIVTGAASLGIAAGAILGGTLAAYTTAQGVKFYKNHHYKAEQKKQTNKDLELLKQDRIDDMKSDLGIMIRLAEAVSSEQNNLDESDEMPMSDLVKNYLGTEPKLFLRMMSTLKDELKNLSRVTTEIEIDEENENNNVIIDEFFVN